jgi:hypothetical protein
MMTSVPLASATSGMQLACDLRDENDNVLLPQGCVLTPTIINALQRRGIVYVDLADADMDSNSDTDTIDTSPAPTADIAQRIDQIFRRGGGTANLQLKAALHRLRQVEQP